VAEGSSFTPATIISVFGLGAVSALIYAGVTMQRISQLETNDERFALQLSAMAESRFQKQAEFEEKIASLQRTDAARTEEMKSVHNEILLVQKAIDGNSAKLSANAALLMDRMGEVNTSIEALRYGLMRSDERRPPR
jgi:phage I-like protein